MKRSDVDNLDKLEEYYKKNRKIKFDDIVKINDINDIYNSLFNFNSYSYPFNNLGTFYKKGTIHCQPNKYRSIDDFITLSKNYFKDVTVKEILVFLVEKENELLKKNKAQNFGYCPNIRKYNYRGIFDVSVYNNSKRIKSYKFNDLFPNLKLSVEKIIQF